MTRRSVVAPAEGRIDSVVGDALGLSRAKLKTLFEEGLVRVDGKRVKKGMTVAAGANIEVELAEEAPATALPDPMVPLHVLHEDEALLFIDKPAGVPCQPQQAGELGCIANALVARDANATQVSIDPREAGLCHRLDIETAGVLLAAKTRAAWDAMRAAFSNPGSVEKRYWALVEGPLADEGDIDLPLAHHGNHVRPSFVDGRAAVSHFRVLRRAGARCLVEVRIDTGVLHQVRAHLAAVGAPIINDELYGGAQYGLPHFFLHAHSLVVQHPVSGMRVEVTAPLPTQLNEALAKLLPPTTESSTPSLQA